MNFTEEENLEQLDDSINKSDEIAPRKKTRGRPRIGRPKINTPTPILPALREKKRWNKKNKTEQEINNHEEEKKRKHRERMRKYYKKKKRESNLKTFDKFSKIYTVLSKNGYTCNISELESKLETESAKGYICTCFEILYQAVKN